MEKKAENRCEDSIKIKKLLFLEGRHLNPKNAFNLRRQRLLNILDNSPEDMGPQFHMKISKLQEKFKQTTVFFQSLQFNYS